MRLVLLVSVLSAALAGCVADADVQPVYAQPQPPPPPQQPMVQAQVYADPASQQPAPPPQDYQGGDDGSYDDDSYAEPSSMVYVSPDVEVIEDYDYPVFFSSGLYWRYDGGTWYSSSWHDRGWVSARDVPVSVRHINRPTAYVHYHADVNARPGQAGYRATTRVQVSHPAGRPPHRTEPNGRPSPQRAQPGGYHPEQGRPEQGRPEQGRPEQGRPEQGRPEQGRPEQGRPEQGRPEQGRPEQGGPRPEQGHGPVVTPQREEPRTEPREGGSDPHEQHPNQQSHPSGSYGQPAHQNPPPKGKAPPPKKKAEHK